MTTSAWKSAEDLGMRIMILDGPECGSFSGLDSDVSAPGSMRNTLSSMLSASLVPICSCLSHELNNRVV